MTTESSTTLGLRVDVDTFRGTRLGVPALTEVFRRRGIRASFFFSVGPDNMGRHLWRLRKPGFLRKMLRSDAAGLYGWDILLRGTIWPGPVIGRRAADAIGAAALAGHEIGLHAWDHHQWQTRLEEMPSHEIHDLLSRGVRMLQEITGAPPTCSAAPAWHCTGDALLEKTRFPFSYNSDCRGTHPFFPVIGGQRLRQPQVPVTLPTYDEVIGLGGVGRNNYNGYLLSLVRPGAFNVLTVHAEVEGIACAGMFEAFLEEAEKRGIAILPLGELLAGWGPVGHGTLTRREIPGREGALATQAPPPPAPHHAPASRSDRSAHAAISHPF